MTTSFVLYLPCFDYICKPHLLTEVIRLSFIFITCETRITSRATGVNSQNVLADDEVTITQVERRDGEGYSQSWLLATLQQGESYTIDEFWPSTHIEVESIDLTSSPGTATIRFSTEFVPTASPTPSPPECLGSDPQTCGCDEVLQADYRGLVNTTATGLICQDWNSQLPHPHSRTPGNYPNKGLEEGNYCRNPDGEPGGLWCYTNDPNVRWQYCDVPSCTPPPTVSPQPTDAPSYSPTSAAPTTAQPTTNAPTPMPHFCDGVDDNILCCGSDDVKQADYRGDINKTQSGVECQAWDSQVSRT